MTPERWREAERILRSLLELDPGERAAALPRACGDDEEMRREILFFEHDGGPSMRIGIRIAALVVAHGLGYRYKNGRLLPEPYLGDGVRARARDDEIRDACRTLQRHLVQITEGMVARSVRRLRKRHLRD